MANLELLNTPFFISAANMVTPLATITIDTLYENVLTLANIVRVGIETFAFIMKEGIIEAFTNLTLEKIVYMLVVYNLFMLMAIDNQRKKIAEQNKLIESLEKNVVYLKKTERMREDLEQMWVQDVREYHADTTKKFALVDKKMKKLEKDLKQYE